MQSLCRVNQLTFIFCRITKGTTKKEEVFTAHVIHSLPLHMSAIHVLQNDQIVCTSHLIGLDQLPQGGYKTVRLKRLNTFWSCLRILKLHKNPMQFQTMLPISYLSTSSTKGNRTQCLKFYWIFKQLKNSKTTSEGVTFLFSLYVILTYNYIIEVLFFRLLNADCLRTMGMRPSTTHN